MTARPPALVAPPREATSVSPVAEAFACSWVEVAVSAGGGVVALFPGAGVSLRSLAELEASSSVGRTSH